MNRVATFLSLGPSMDASLDWALRYALVQCLAPEEVCRAIDTTFNQEYFERRRLLARAVRDLASGPLPCHGRLVEELFLAYPRLDHRRKQSCASTLFTLADACASLGRNRLIQIVLAESSVSLRRQAFKSLRGTWAPECEDFVEQSWASHRDPEAFELLIDHKPLDWLAEQIDEAFEAAAKGGTLARAVIRLAPSVPSVLDRLFDTSPTSWAYASAKLGGPADARRSRAAFDRAVDSDDRGLVVWSIGQLKQWDLLLELHQVPGPTLEQILARQAEA